MKDIILYGVGIEAEKFYCLYHAEFRIKYCIDRSGQKKFHGIEVYTLEEKIKELSNEYIVLTLYGESYKQVKKILEKNGLQEYRNFIQSAAINKKLVIVYGNCHMGGIASYLRENCYFSKKFFVKYFYGVMKEVPAKEDFDKCDVFITQDIRKNNECEMLDSDTIKTLVNENCKVFVVPNLFGCNLFYPQYKKHNNHYINSHIGKDAIDLEKFNDERRQFIIDSIESMSKNDSYIDQAYQQGKTVEDIEKDIEEATVYSQEEIIALFEKNLMKLREREKQCDIIISDYLVANYKTIQLFYEPEHPASIVIREMGKRILEKMEIQPIESEVEVGIGVQEMPIYGCVKKVLGLMYEQPILRRQYSMTLLNMPETLRDYITNYIAWVWGNKGE